MAIRYLSFDFDGCLFNQNYAQAPHLEFKKHLGDAVLVHNRAFLDQLKIENAAFDNVVALIGSNRQSYETDCINMGHPKAFKGSCCPAIQTVCADLNVTFDPFLLADVAGNLPYGTSYHLIMQEVTSGAYLNDDPQHEHAECTMDETKRTLLFAQMQKAAVDHPNEEIIFDFFDDRYDILVGHLNEFFTKYPHMIPKNVTLRLNRYAGDDVTLMASIKGTGESYSDYPEHVNNMLDNLWGHDEIAKTLKVISKEHTDSVLENFIKLEEHAIALESSIQNSEHIADRTETIDELGAALASLNLVAQEIEPVDDYMDVDENEELATEKELDSSNNQSTLSYFTDNSSGEPRAKLAFAKKSYSQNEINRWFAGYQQPEYIEDGDRIILFINVHPDSPFKDPSLFEAIEILRQQHIELSDNAIETLQNEFNLVIPVLENAKSIAMADGADFKIYLDGYTNAFSDMPVDYLVKYKNHEIVENDGREKEAGVSTNDFSDMSDESSDEDSDLEFFEDNGREKELDAGTDDISDSDLSVDASDEESDLELVEDNGREKEADAGRQTLATEPSTIHARSQAEPANQQRNPAGNPGRNQYAFHKPVAAPKINRAPIALPEDKLCSGISSCLIS
ncbi:hypothetical protein OQJ19_12245 [Fluoribacter gormanii]|uniref:hypothetical protein n=1 Tax=Fluoribacter gormanii TaxID=464 RepID=UPI0022439980|nr:hypothetical protein [Fluoribacter gormanii]MCW8471410.1 hypothetical protein [Fluoribacter gormanii]